MFSWYKYVTVNLFFSYLGFWSAIFFLIAPFPDLCLLVPFQIKFGFNWPSCFRRCLNIIIIRCILSKVVADQPLETNFI